MNPALFTSLTVLICSLLLPGVLGAQSSDGLQLGNKTSQGAGKGSDASPTLDLGPASKPAAAQAGAVPAPSGSVQQEADLVRTKFGSWEVACAAAGAPCVMAQIGNDSKGTPMLEVVIRKLPEPQTVQNIPVVAVADIITPLGVVLTSGVVMKVDSAKEQRAPFQICTEQGCLVREPLTEEAVNQFKRGNNALLTIVGAQQGGIQVNVSLSGFTKAYQSLK